MKIQIFRYFKTSLKFKLILSSSRLHMVEQKSRHSLYIHTGKIILPEGTPGEYCGFTQDRWDTVVLLGFGLPAGHLLPLPRTKHPFFWMYYNQSLNKFTKSWLYSLRILWELDLLQMGWWLPLISFFSAFLWLSHPTGSWSLPPSLHSSHGSLSGHKF